MKSCAKYFSGTLCIVLILVFAVIIAGCTSAGTSSKSNTSPSSPAAPSGVSVQQTAAPISGAQAPAASAAVSSSAGLTTARLADGVTLAYPSDWQKDEVSELSTRDYGRATTNIANFYSPDITSERAKQAYPNVDTSKYTTLSVDVDSQHVTDFEQYFNLVAVALQNHYGSIEITKHNYQLKISKTDTFEGYKSYQMDFDTKDMRGSYIFTNVDGTIYIFAFKNPSPYSSEVQDIYKSIQIVPVTSSDQKHR
jgi:hypothetical protein